MEDLRFFNINMDVTQKQSRIPFNFGKKDNLRRLKEIFQREEVVRFAVVQNENGSIDCDYAVVSGDGGEKVKNIFNFFPAQNINRSQFNAVMIVPTGVGAEVGGDSGDANPAARLIGNTVDNLFTHPNVVNAADFNEMTPNTQYVEGSVLNRFMMGSVGLAPVRKNRMLLVYDATESDDVKCCTINTASAARMTLGCEIETAELTDPPKYSYFFNDNNIAVGKIINLEKLTNLIKKYQSDYDSIVLFTHLEGNHAQLFTDYCADKIEVNPWGGIEAMITHSVSNLLDVSVAHAPMIGEYIEDCEFPIVNPQKSAETLSSTELFCVIKGMYKTPKIVDPICQPGIFTNRDIHVLVTPDRCIGLPLLAALEQGIAVIAVDDPHNTMKNDLSTLPWAPNQFFRAKNYLEASGIITALKNGISPGTVTRPVSPTVMLH